jgi:outer membrane protein TolC
MKTLKLFLLALLPISLIPTSIWAQALPLSLKEAQELAMDSSYASRNAKFNTEKKIKEVKEVLGIGLPQVNASGEYNQFLQIPVSVIPSQFLGGEEGNLTEVEFGVPYNFTGSITASQLIFDGTYIIGLKASKTVVELAEQEQLKTEQEVRLQVAEAYHTVLLAEANLKILSDNLDNLNKTLSDTRALYENGLTEEQDVDQILLNRNQIQINYDNSQRLLEIAQQTLNFIIGLPLSREVVLTDKIEDLVQLNNDESYLSRKPDLGNHPDYLLARTNVEIQNLTLSGEKAAYYPSLTGFINYQQQAQRLDFNFFDTSQPWFPASTFGVQLNVPIFSGFQRNARRQQAEIGVEQSLMQLTQVTESLNLEIERTRGNFLNALKTWKNQKESQELAQRILDKTNIKYAEGIATSFELNVAQSQLLNEQNKYITAAFELLTAKQELDRALNIY